MRVWIDAPPFGDAEGRMECTVTRVQDGSADIALDGGVTIGRYTGTLYDAEGAEITMEAVEAALNAEAAQKIYDQLAAAGILDDILAAVMGGITTEEG